MTYVLNMSKVSEATTANACAMRLSSLAPLSAAEIAAINRLTARSRSFKARADLVRSEDDPSAVLAVLSGFACCYRQHGNGKRQNLAYLLPGDLLDLSRLGPEGVGALSACRVAFVPREAFQDMLAQHAQVAEAVRLADRVREAISREWLLNLGSRSAVERIAHLFCELLARLQAVDLATAESCAFPISQSELSATVGLSPVHVNRTLQELRRASLIELKGRMLQIKDRARLQALGGFAPGYLQASGA